MQACPFPSPLHCTWYYVCCTHRHCVPGAGVGAPAAHTYCFIMILTLFYSPQHMNISAPYAGVPDSDTVSQVQKWAHRLCSVISDEPLPCMPPGSELVPTAEAVAIMQVNRLVGWLAG